MYIYTHMLLWNYFLISIAISMPIHDDDTEIVQLNSISKYYSNI